jgi:hypothetical protein
MIEELKRFLHVESEGAAWDPAVLEQEWPDYARKVFDGFPVERGHGCDLMLISTHPEEHTGNPSWPRSYVHICRSPEFQADKVPVHKLGSIGSGNDYEPCRKAIERFSNDLDSQDLLIKGEIGSSGGMGTMLGYNLTQLLMQAQPGGISSHLHYCWVYRGQIVIKPNNHDTMGRWSMLEHGSGIHRNRAILDTSNPNHSADSTRHDVVAFRMPRIATTWEELCELVDSHILNVNGCVA